MPIVFEQPDPMGYASSIGVGAGQAAATQKMAPTLAQLYEHIAELRQRSAMSGGGGGGSSSATPGGGGVGPGYYGGGGSGSDFDVQQQANREQSALNLGAQLRQPDYVGQHIQQAEQFKVQQQQAQQAQRQQQLAALNGQGQPQQPPQPAPEFDAFDQRNLDNAKQQVDTLQAKYEAGELGGDNPEAQSAYAQAQSKIAALQKKQQDVQQYQSQQAFQAASQAQAQKRALIDTDMKHADANGHKQIPDLPTPVYDVDDHGKKYLVNHEVMKIAADDQKEAKKYNRDMDLKNLELKVKTDEAEDKHLRDDRAAAVKELTTKDKDGKAVIPSHEQISERAKQIGQERLDAKEQRNLEKNANPQVRAAYVDHLDSLPKDDGKPDYNKASTEQLAKVGGFLGDPKAVGVTKKEAKEGLAKITEILTARDVARKAAASAEIVPGKPGLPPPPPRGVTDTPSHVFQYDASKLDPNSPEYKRLTSHEPTAEEIAWYKSTHGGQSPPNEKPKHSRIPGRFQ